MHASMTSQELNKLNKITRSMQRKVSKYGKIRPCKLLTSSTRQAKILNSLQTNPSQKPSNEEKTRMLGNRLGDRYSAEVASVSKMKEYEMVATRQKEVLFNENRNLREKFSEELKEAITLESNVTKISNSITEFLQILQSQSETVQDVHRSGVDAIEQVQQTEDELALTVKRADSYNNMMFLIIMVFSVVLILLDYLSP